MLDSREENVLIFIVILVLLFLVLSLLVISMIYKYQKKQMLHFLGVNELQSKHENEILKTQIKIQEATFQNISKEIHDNIGQKLSLAKLQLNTSGYDKNKFYKDLIHDAIQNISESISDLRDLSRSMSSDFIANLGLIKALENEIGQVGKTGQYKFKFTLTGEPIYMDAEKELMLFRIVQESINNTIKHAHSTEIHILLHYTSMLLQIDIVDNGIGFDVSISKEGQGLSNIKNRAILLNGEATITSAIGKGTQITIKIPLNESEKI